MAKVKVDAYQCERCGHIWLPRNKVDEPKVCPKCKSPYWNTPRKAERKAKQREDRKDSEKGKGHA
jgi:predicted Zn-ribbon and HTH transcriptional regulator